MITLKFLLKCLLSSFWFWIIMSSFELIVIDRLEQMLNEIIV